MEYQIKGLPFEGLSKIQDILYSDGPILSHYTDSFGKEILFYWVDFNDENNCWLVFETNKTALYNYLTGGVSLRKIITELDSEFVYLVNEDSNGSYNDVRMLVARSINENYLPDERSYYTLGLPTFYDSYLVENSYIERLKERSYVFHLEPSDRVHATTVSAKEAGMFLIGITKSIESYIDFTATDRLKNHIPDRNRFNRTINQLKQKVAPRIADVSFGSFEVCIGIDTVTLHTTNNDILEWGKGVIDGFKYDVLDVDFAKEEGAAAVLEKFPDADSRKKIFDPIIKILENRDLELSVTSYNRSFSRQYSKSRPTDRFKKEIIPPQTIEEYLIEQQKRTQIVTAVFKLPEGGNISDLKKKELLENLLFTQEDTHPVYPLPNPIATDERSEKLKRPLECVLMIDANGQIQMFNTTLGLQAEGDSMSSVVDSIKEQFFELLDQRRANPEYVDEKTQELDSLLENAD